MKKAALGGCKVPQRKFEYFSWFCYVEFGFYWYHKKQRKLREREEGAVDNAVIVVEKKRVPEVIEALKERGVKEQEVNVVLLKGSYVEPLEDAVGKEQVKEVRGETPRENGLAEDFTLGMSAVSGIPGTPMLGVGPIAQGMRNLFKGKESKVEDVLLQYTKDKGKLQEMEKALGQGKVLLILEKEIVEEKILEKLLDDLEVVKVL